MRLLAPAWLVVGVLIEVRWQLGGQVGTMKESEVRELQGTCRPAGGASTQRWTWAAVHRARGGGLTPRRRLAARRPPTC